MAVRPLGERVIVRSLEEKERTTTSGIVLQGTAADSGPAQRGEVVASGKDVKTSELAEGDTVLYSKYGGVPVTVEGEELVLLRLEDVLAVLEDD